MTLRSVLSAVLAALTLVSGAPAVAQPKTELDRCVPADLARHVISFRTEDHVVLPGLVFGSGSRGVLLAHSGFEPICAWLPLARQLADGGYQVLLYQARNEAIPKGSYWYDLDVMGAAMELYRRDVSAIVAGGAGTSATGVAATAGRISGLRGLFLLRPFARTSLNGRGLDAVAGIRSVDLPSVVSATEMDLEGARQVAGAASGARLKIVPDIATEAALVGDAALRDDLRAFVRESMPSRSLFERWWWPIGALLVLVAAGVIVFRRKRAVGG